MLPHLWLAMAGMLLAVTVLDAGCGPSLPAQPPPSSPLSNRAQQPPLPEIATTLTRDPLALPASAEGSPPRPGAHSGHGGHMPGAADKHDGEGHDHHSGESNDD